MSYRQFSTNMLAVAALTAIQGCGGDDQPPSGPIAVPAPTPAPTPAPSQPATPTPAPSSGLPPILAGARIGETVSGPLVCSDGALTLDAEGAVIGVGPISRAQIDTSLSIRYVAADTFVLDLNGFGGGTYGPALKRSYPTAEYLRFADPLRGEFLLARNGLAYVTSGVAAESGLCMYAAGLPALTLPTGVVSYVGLVDGFGVVSGQQVRLSAANVDASLDFARGTGQLSFQLMRSAIAAGSRVTNPGTAPAVLATVTANLTIAPTSRTLSGTASGGGYAGTVKGSFVSQGQSVLGPGIGGTGIALVFELRSASGDILYGALPLSADLI